MKTFSESSAVALVVGGLAVAILSAGFAQAQTSDEEAAAKEAEALGVVSDMFLGKASPEVRREAKDSIEKDVNEWHGTGGKTTSGTANGSSSGYQKTYGNSGTSQEEAKCHNMVQGKVAWNWAGTRRWNKGNIERLCNNTASAENTVVCFEGVMAIRDDWSRAINACSL